MESAADRPGLRPKRACRACIQIKAKCVPRTGSGLSICERCYRLGKECTTPAPMKRPRRQPAKVVELQNQIANLSKELEEAKNNVDVVLPTPDSFGSTPGSYHRPEQPRFSNPSYECHPVPRIHRPGSIYDISPEIGHVFLVHIYEHHFATFRNSMAIYLPFITLPADLPTATLMKNRPFLSAVCIMTALHADPGLQARIGRDILDYLSRHMLILGEKSLDLIQGLLVMVAWYRVYTQSDPQLMNLLHLAKALLVDLGLNRAPDAGCPAIKVVSSEATQMIYGTGSVSAHSLDERRTMLAFYYINSKFSCSWRRLDPIIWTSHLEDCCRILQDLNDHPFDHLTVALVRLRHLVEKYNGLDAGIKPGSSLPLPSYVALFKSDLNQYRANLPTDLLLNPMLDLEIAHSELCLLEPVLSAPCANSAHKVEVLHICLTKVIAYFDKMAARKIEEFQHVPFLTWMSCAYAFDLLARLCFLSADGWSLDYVRKNPGFLAVNDQMRKLLLKADEHAQITGTNRSNRFKMLAGRLDRFDDWYHSRLQQEQDQLSLHETTTDGEHEPSNTLEMPLVFNDFSNFLWSDLVDDWPALRSDIM